MDVTLIKNRLLWVSGVVLLHGNTKYWVKSVFLSRQTFASGSKNLVQFSRKNELAVFGKSLGKRIFEIKQSAA